MHERSSLYRAIDRLFGDESLAEFVEAHRRNERSWRRISREIENKTGVSVSYETLRDWFPELAERAA